MNTQNYYTCSQAARELHLASGDVARQYIAAGLLKATKFGSQWAIPSAEVQRMRTTARTVTRIARTLRKEATA